MLKSYFKRVKGSASIAGTTLYTVPAGSDVTITGLRVANTDPLASHTFHIEAAGTLITGLRTLLPIGSAFEVTDGKIMLEAGDTIKAFADEDSKVSVYVSFLARIEE